MPDDETQVKKGLIITRKGLDVLAKACAGKELCYTRVKFGDSVKNGSVVEPTDAQVVEFTNLIHERDMTLPIAECKFGGGGTAVIQFQVNNADLATGFWARETGLFARDPDTNEEILYAYKNDGVLSKYICGGGGAVAINLFINLVTIVDNATNVTAIIDASLVRVSQAEFIEHINSTRPHPNVPCVKAAVSTSPAFWATGTDNHLHPISSENLSLQILGDNAYELPHLAKRISQNETNIANLFMQLDTEKTLGLEANLLLAEDFTDNSACDLLKVKVRNEISGANTVWVEDIAGILEGHFYTLTDGTKSQTLQVESTRKNGGKYAVFFTENLSKNFNLDKTYLYRSTGVIADKTAGGAGEMRESVFHFGDVWQGEGSSSEKVLTLSTSLKNKDNFTLSGDWAFDNGFFTISF